MKGILVKRNTGDWVVWWADSTAKNGVRILPLLQEDVKQIDEWSKVFDNIEARIANDPEVEFEISEIITTDTDGTRMVKYAKLINEEKSTKHSKQKKHTNIKRMYSEDDVKKLMFMAAKWDTFKDGDVEYGMDMDNFFKYLIESLDIK